MEQIDLCEKEIEYFEGLEQQLELANFEDAREIREELAALGYMKPIQSKNPPQPQRRRPCRRSRRSAWRTALRYISVRITFRTRR